MSLRQRLIAMMVAPVLLALSGDVFLSATYTPDTFDGLLALQLMGHAAVQLLGVVAAFAALWAGANAVAMVAGRFRDRLAKWFYLGAVATVFLICDQLVDAHTFTRHWMLPIIRGAAVVGLLAGLATYAFKPTFFRSPGTLLWVAVACIGLSMLLVCVFFGGSILPHTPKYAREPIAALLILHFELLWLIFALVLRSRSAKTLGRVGAAGFVCWLAAVAVAGALPERGRYVVVTSLETTRSMRHFNRAIAHSFPLRLLPWVRSYAGERVTPRWPAPTDLTTLECRRVRTSSVRSVLLLTVDALRSDYYGIDVETLPGVTRQRDQSVEFVNAYQATSGTVGSTFAMHVGRYSVAPSPTRDLWPILSRDLGVEQEFIMQQWGESPKDFTTGLETRIAEWTSRGAPFLFHAHYLSVHMPGGMARLSHDYPAELRKIDLQIARLLEFIRSRNLEDETMVILTTDHGEELQHERGYVSHGYGVTNTLLHVPLFVRMPGLAPGRRETPVSGVDVGPTVLEALGVRCNYQMHGRSLLAPGEPDRTLFASSMSPSPAIGPKALTYSDLHTVIHGTWKLVLNRGANALALYDLEADPSERRNLADRHTGVVRDLLRLLDAYLDGELDEHPAGGSWELP